MLTILIVGGALLANHVKVHVACTKLQTSYSVTNAFYVLKCE